MGAIEEQPGGQSPGTGEAAIVQKLPCACERCGYCVGETLAVCGGCGAAAVRDTPGRRGDRRMINRMLGVLLCVQGLHETARASFYWWMLSGVNGGAWHEAEYVVDHGLPAVMGLITVGVGVCMWRLKRAFPGARRRLRVGWISAMVAALIVYRAYEFFTTVWILG